jgi:hypothetical protein
VERAKRVKEQIQERPRKGATAATWAKAKPKGFGYIHRTRATGATNRCVEDFKGWIGLGGLW